MYPSLREKYPSLLQNFNQISIFKRIFEQSSNTKFHENPFIGSRIIPCGQTDESKLIDPIRNVANVPKNEKH
jgi:hypothetical protein